jgi:hypothetical protein
MMVNHNNREGNPGPRAKFARNEVENGPLAVLTYYLMKVFAAHHLTVFEKIQHGL